MVFQRFEIILLELRSGKEGMKKVGFPVKRVIEKGQMLEVTFSWYVYTSVTPKCD